MPDTTEEWLREPPLKLASQTTETPQPMSGSHAKTELPVLPGFTYTLTRSGLGTKLYQSTFDFNLHDPNCHIMKPSYNSLHDPSLNEYYHHRAKHDKLKRMKFITEEDQVICSLKEYNTYKQYLHAVKIDRDKTFNKKMREQMIKLVKLQEEGHISEDVTLGDMRELLVDNLTLSLTSREKPRAGQQIGSCSARREKALCKQLYKEEWVSKELHSLLKVIERDLKQEVNQAKYLREIKEKRDNKKNSLLAQKQAIQQRKDREILQYLQEYERMRETRIKQNMFLEQIFQAPELAPVVQRPPLPARFKLAKRIVSLAGASPIDERMLRSTPRLDHLSPLPGNCKPTLAREIKTQLNSSTEYESTFTEPGTNTETNGEVDAIMTRIMQAVQPEVTQDTKVRKKEPKNQTKPKKAPKLGKIGKPINLIQPRSQAQLKSVVTNAILDHLGTRPVRRQLAESIACGIDLKTSVQGLKPVVQRAHSSRFVTDLLKCVSRVVNPFKPSDEPVFRLCGGAKDPLSPNGQTDEPPDTEVDRDTLVTTLVNDVMESIREKVSVQIGLQQVPEKFQVISAKASQTALDVVSDMLQDVQEFLVQGQVGHLKYVRHFGEGTSVPTGCHCEEGSPRAFTSEPPTIYVSEMELEEATSKMEDIACDLINTAYDNLLFKQDLFERLTENEPSKVILDPGNTDVIISGHESLITLPQVGTSPEEKTSALNLQAGPCKLSSAVKVSSRVEMTPSETSLSTESSETNLSQCSIVASVVHRRPTKPCLSMELRQKTAECGNAKEASLVPQDPVVDTEETVSRPKQILRKPAVLKRAAKENPAVFEFHKSSTGKNVPVASKSISFPYLYDMILDGVLDHFNTEPFKDRLAQSVRNEVKRSLSLPQLKTIGLHGENLNETLHEMIEDLMKSATQKVKAGCQSFSVENPANDETFAKLQAAASQLMKHIFQNVRVRFADKIKQGSPKRRLSPKVSQTAIDAMSNVLGGMETNVMTKASNSPSTSTNSLDELLVEALFEHPVHWFDSPKIEAISDDLVENVLDMCYEMVLSGELPPEKEPEVDDEHHLSRFNVGTIPSQTAPIQNESTSHIDAVCVRPPITVESDDMCEPIVNRRLPQSSPGWNSADASRLIRMSCTLDPATRSPQRKMYTARRSTSFPHLYYLSIIDGVLDHMTTEPFKDKMAQSVRNEVRRSLSLPDFGLADLRVPGGLCGPWRTSEDRADKDMIEDMLRSVSAKLSHCTPKSSQASQRSAHRSDPWASAAEEHAVRPEDTQVASLAKMEAVAREYIITFLEEVKAMLINKIKQGSPQRVLSASVSHMAICAVNSILGSMGTSIREASTHLIPVTAALQTGLSDLTSASVAEAVTRHPGTWLSPSKMDYLTSGLLETVFDNLLDEDSMILREPRTSASWKDRMTLKADGEMSPPGVGKRGTSKPASAFSGRLHRKSKCISFPSEYEMKSPAVSEQGAHHSRSMDSLALGRRPVLTSRGKDVPKKTYRRATLGREQSTEETGSSAVSMKPQRRVSQPSVSELCVRRDSDSPLETTGSESDSPTEGEAMRVSETDVKDGRLAADPKPKKVRLPWGLVRKLRELPDKNPDNLKKVKVYTVYRNPLYFPTGIMRSTGPSSSDEDARSLTPEKVQSRSPSPSAQSARKSYEEAYSKPEARSSQTGRTESLPGMDKNLLAWEVMLSVRDQLNSVTPVSPTSCTRPEAMETARALSLGGMPRRGSPAGRTGSHNSLHREIEN